MAQRGLLLFCLLLHPLLSNAASSYNFSLLIDCGGQDDLTSQFNRSWIADQFYSAGSIGIVSNPQNFLQPQERTVRFFPVSSGKKNCNDVDVPVGRYFIRTFTVYDNYDAKMQTPSFDVSVEGTLVFSYRSPWEEIMSRNGAYSDLFAFVNDGQATVCFYSIATNAPVIGSLELVQVDPLSYNPSITGTNLILVNYGRLACGQSSFGPGYSNHTDYFGRSWQEDTAFRRSNFNSGPLRTSNPIRGADQAPNYFPQHLYQTAIIGESLEYQLNVDTRLDYLMVFHFAEIPQDIMQPGLRIFDIYVNGINVTRMDIFQQAGGSYTAIQWSYTIRQLNNSLLRVRLEAVAGWALTSGLEIYAMIPMDFATATDQAFAMHALKESLHVPDRMGWNGDPCAPSNWDAWEGVTRKEKVPCSRLMVLPTEGWCRPLLLRPL